MEKTAGSRLMQMQARFQQKQLQERELKIASLYETQQARALDRVRHSPSTGSSNSSPPQHAVTQINHQPGKVRQMFQERRTKAGIDKSYPLQPIHNTDRQAVRRPLPNGYTKVTSSNNNMKVTEKSTRTHTTKTVTSSKKEQHKIENLVNGSGDLNHNHEPDHNLLKHALSQNNGGTQQNDMDSEDGPLLQDETFPECLAPTPTPRDKEPTRPPRKSPPATTRPRSPTKQTVNQNPKAPPRKTSNENKVTHNSVTENNNVRGVMQRGTNPVPKRQPVSPGSASGAAATVKPRPSSASAGGVPCTVCGRNFASDRLEKHETICRKSQAKKRKPFDALKHRLAGTDAENYKARMDFFDILSMMSVHNFVEGTEAEQFIGKLRKGKAKPSAKEPPKTLNSSWRQKHEEFIQAIRAAKQVQQYIAKGGKLKDLPPPPPSENPDYVNCPHCNRRFNQQAAERHIPKCANYQFNKPKPAPAKRR